MWISKKKYLKIASRCNTKLLFLASCYNGTPCKHRVVAIAISFTFSIQMIPILIKKQRAKLSLPPNVKI